MPSRDPNKQIKSPSFRGKLQQVKGLSAAEKALFLRIGNLVDFLSYQSRQESNPKGQARTKSIEIPVPQNVTTTVISSGVIIEWEPVDFSALSFYEVQISTDSVFSEAIAFEVIDKRFTYRDEIGQTLFFRVRTVSKQGYVSAFSNTASIPFSDDTLEVDFDHIEPENRTTILPKPTLHGATLNVFPGNQISVGVGAVFSGSPLTISDIHIGFPSTGEKRNEITYDLMERNSPFPSLEQRISGPPDHFFEQSGFYELTESETGGRFYIDTFIYPSSFVDFFATQTLSGTSAETDIEFLRYRITRSFYFPDFSQTGIVPSASFAALKL